MHNADIGSIGTNKTHVGSDGGPTLCNCRVKNEACRDNDFPHFVICAKYAKVAADLPFCLVAFFCFASFPVPLKVYRELDKSVAKRCGGYYRRKMGNGITPLCLANFLL